MPEDADRLVRRFADAAGMSTDELLAQILGGRFEEEAEARAAETLAQSEDDDDGELEESERWSEAVAEETDDSDDDARWWT